MSSFILFYTSGYSVLHSPLAKTGIFGTMLGVASRTGGMADAGDSKSPARKGVPVQVRGSVLDVKSKTAHVCAPFVRGAECYKNVGASGKYPMRLGFARFRAVT